MGHRRDTTGSKGQRRTPKAAANCYNRVATAAGRWPTVYLPRSGLAKHRHRWHRWGTYRVPSRTSQYHRFGHETAVGEILREVDLFDIDLCRCGLGRIARNEEIEHLEGSNRTVLWPKMKYFEGGLVVGLFGRPIEDDGGLLIADN
jgi:hypothetical protein